VCEFLRNLSHSYVLLTEQVDRPFGVRKSVQIERRRAACNGGIEERNDDRRISGEIAPITLVEPRLRHNAFD
jgi:hypothetical protein